MYNRVDISSLSDRLDAEYYTEDQIQNLRVLDDFGIYPLYKVCTNINVGYTGELTSQYTDEGTVLFRVSDIDSLFLKEDKVKYVPDVLADENEQIWIKDGDIVLAAVGNTIGKVAIKTSHLPNGVCSRALMITRPIFEKIDSHFLVAYLGCKFAQKSLIRGISGSAQPVLNTPLIANLPIVKVNSIAQKYIANKVRQAELLKEWAKRIYSDVQRSLDQNIGSYDESISRYERVTHNFLSERLDQNHYQRNLLDCHKLLITHPHVLLGDTSQFSNLTDGDHGNPQYGDGPIYLRANEISNGLIEKSNVVRLDKLYADKVSRSCWTKANDIIFSIVGTLGMTAVIDHETVGLMSRGIAKITSLELPNYYVKAFFKSKYFSNQLIRHSVGTIQRGVYLEAMKQLMVPILNTDLMDTISAKEKLADLATNLSYDLITASKVMIESIIEGKITENQLIDAQQKIEEGDNGKDRSILKKLTDKGYLAEGGKPLFLDLDNLYELLDEAKNASDDDSAESAEGLV
jgi:type I restriction enzyme S subunit